MTRREVMADQWIHHPGYYLAQILASWHMTRTEFAARTEIAAPIIARIVAQNERVTTATAAKLGKVTHLSMLDWLTLQAKYDDKIARMIDRDDDEERRTVRLLDLSYFKRNGFIENRPYTSATKLTALRQALQTGSLYKLTAFNPAVSYLSTATPIDEKAVVRANAMLNLGSNLEYVPETWRPYGQLRLKAMLPLIPPITQAQPDEWMPWLRAHLDQAGIVLRVLPAMPGAPLAGGLKRIVDRAYMLLVVKQDRYADSFWAALVHELAYLYYDNLHVNDDDYGRYTQKEAKAERFAADLFMPPARYEAFVATGKFTRRAVRAFAAELGIHPGMVVRRLRKEGLISPSALNDLRQVMPD